MGPLKQFLKLRDTSEAYADARQNHYVGIPTLFVDDTPYLVDDTDHAQRLIEELHLVADDQ